MLPAIATFVSVVIDPATTSTAPPARTAVLLLHVPPVAFKTPALKMAPPLPEAPLAALLSMFTFVSVSVLVSGARLAACEMAPPFPFAELRFVSVRLVMATF